MSLITVFTHNTVIFHLNLSVQVFFWFLFFGFFFFFFFASRVTWTGILKALDPWYEFLTKNLSSLHSSSNVWENISPYPNSMYYYFLKYLPVRKRENSCNFEILPSVFLPFLVLFPPHGGPLLMTEALEDHRSLTWTLRLSHSFWFLLWSTPFHLNSGAHP